MPPKRGRQANKNAGEKVSEPKAEKPIETVENPTEIAEKPKRGRRAAAPKPVEPAPVEEKVAVEKPSTRRGKKAAVVEEASSEEEAPVEEPVVKKSRAPAAKSTKPAAKPKAPVAAATKKLRSAAKPEDSDDEEVPAVAEAIAKPAEATAKPLAKEKGKLQNQTDSNFTAIDYNCKKLNANGDKYNLKITSWNVSGIRAAIKKNALDYITSENADIVALQETKCDTAKLPEELNLPGYERYFLSSTKQPGHSGVALYTKKKPLSVVYGIDDEELDAEGRMITVEYDNFYLINAYVPNAGRKLVSMDKKLKWNEMFQKYVVELDGKKPVIICGDMNVAHAEIDLEKPKNNVNNAGFTPQERQGMTDLLAAGFVDTFRELYPELTGAYTFWSYMSDARKKNIGWRLDYYIASEKIKDNVCDNVIRSSVYGSDHCPIVLYIKI